MAFGQLIFGPLSDSTGRKPAVYARIRLLHCGLSLLHVRRRLLGDVARSSAAGTRRGRSAQRADGAHPRQVLRACDGAGDVIHHDSLHPGAGDCAGVRPVHFTLLRLARHFRRLSDPGGVDARLVRTCASRRPCHPHCGCPCPCGASAARFVWCSPTASRWDTRSRRASSAVHFWVPELLAADIAGPIRLGHNLRPVLRHAGSGAGRGVVAELAPGDALWHALSGAQCGPRPQRDWRWPALSPPSSWAGSRRCGR